MVENGVWPGLKFADPDQLAPRTKSSQYIETLENHLNFVEKQIEELVRLSPTLRDVREQDECWERARELEREARATRREIRRAQVQREKEKQ
jgi:hypothetical protein